MAVTPNYSWPVPVNTDLVKDGAEAIKDLGDAIDATVFGLPSGALALVKTQTIGSAVTSVTVTGAFSTTYDAYKIVVSNGASNGIDDVAMLQLSPTTTGYKWNMPYSSYGSGTVIAQGNNNDSHWRYVACFDTNGLRMNLDILNPFLNKQTSSSNMFAESAIAGTANGILTNTTSYTDFILSIQGGSTMTGGTIRVYGYQN